MDKQQAYYSFWNSFNIPAYDETSVPDTAELPYITFQVLLDDLDHPVYPNASVWYRGTSWADIDAKIAEISERLTHMLPIELDEGYMFIVKGSPFAQRLADEADRTIKRYVLNLQVEFLVQT